MNAIFPARCWVVLALGWFVSLSAGYAVAAERIPLAPAQYFNDYAGVVPARTVSELNAKLEQTERATSNQLLVAIFPRMESDSSVQDYTVRVAEAWRVGQAKRDNGAVLFVFMKEREVFIQVGYGLAAVLPDALAKRIIENEIVPNFRRGDVDAGLRAAVDAMIAATKGEYQGTGRTQADRRNRGSGGTSIGGFVVLLIIFIVLSRLFRGGGGGTVIGSPSFGRRRSGGFLMGPPRGGGGWRGGGGGGFSGGGGSFGGGGAGGRW